MDKLMIGALQLPTLGANATRLEFYLKKAKERGAKILLLGEYVINLFFKNLLNMNIDMIKDQTRIQLNNLKKLSKEFDIIIVAPIIDVKNGKVYKRIAKISPKSVSYYDQQVLINYSHWDEESFFANKVSKLKKPMIFELDGFKIAVMFGFEVHFDHFWIEIQKRGVDIVFVPTANTLNSSLRWQELLSMRAFLNSCYILRANRVGEYEDNNLKWYFYGESMLISPEGETLISLEDKESMLIEEIEKEEIEDALDGWAFRDHLKKRGEI